MSRGGRRSGTPGVAYPNRTDLSANRAPQTGANTAASAGVQAPAHTVSAPPPPPPQPQGLGLTPDQTPNLFDPGQPGKPLTSGLPTGPGPGPAQGPNDVAIIAQYLPSLQEIAKRQGTPDSFKALVRYLQGH